MSKNIVVLSDGTGQDGGKGHDSNVYKLFRMLADRTEDQIVFYDEGLGTGAHRLAGMAFGAGIDDNILQCYRFIFEHYQAGDKIFLFGFSRGAATVRSLASFIHYFGILPASRPELIEQAYKIYKNRKVSYHKYEAKSQQEDGTLQALNNAVHRFNDALRDDLDQEGGKSDEFVRLHPNQWVQIEFLGVWDTVPALGLVALPGLDALLDHVPAWKHQYHNFKLRGSVKHACHALSIDDERKWFFPSIWKEYDPELTEKVEQVWFGGAHTDVGGGFWEAGYSDIALEWMVQKAFEHGLRLYLDSRSDWNFCVAPDPTDDFHDPRSAWGMFYTSGKRDKIWDQKAFDSFGPPRVHESVLRRAERFPRKTKELPPPPSLWEKVLAFFRPKPEGSKDLEYWPWILDTYPKTADKDEWFRKHYEEVWAPSAYKRWCKKELRNSSEQKALPTLSEWKSQPQNSFDQWMADHNVFQELKLNGMSVLVEKIRNVVHNPAGDALVLTKTDREAWMKIEPARKALVLRDYDRDHLLEILQDALTYESLKRRAWKFDIKSGKMKRSYKKALANDPNAIPRQYRIDRDAMRWEISVSRTSESGPPAD